MRSHANEIGNEESHEVGGCQSRRHRRHRLRKSSFCAFFERQGVPVFYADLESRRMINEDPSVRSAIIKLFGSSAYAKGELDRKAISAIVFSDKTKLDAMTAIVRPALWRRFNAWKKPITAPYVLMEAATLIENGGQELVDHIVSVTAPEDVRIKRAMQRDGATEEQVRSRINNQTSEEERLKHAGSIIQNGGTPEELEAQAGDLMRYLNRLTLESEPIRGSSRH